MKRASFQLLLWFVKQKEHERNYTPEEDKTRFAIFSKTVAEVNAHNEKFDKGEVSYSQGVNLFSDLTDEERSKYHGVPH